MSSIERELAQKDIAYIHRMLKWAEKSEAAPRLHAMIGLCRSEPGIPILPGQLDSNPWLFNCPTGSKGKPTVVGAVLATLGEAYALKANQGLLTKSGWGERHPTEQANLFGKRLVVASETQQGHHLNEGLVKDLTGGEPITARRMK